MIRAVLDANTIASGLIRFRHGTSPPSVILRHWVAGHFELAISESLIHELTRTLSKPYFQARIDPEVWAVILSALRNEIPRIAMSVAVSGIATHPEDDVVLSVAVSASADFLVTGDKQLQRLAIYQGVRIVSPRDFLAFLPVPG